MNKTFGVVLAFLGIFIAGGIAGGLIALRFTKNEGPPRIPPEQFALQMMKRTTGELDLTPEQKEKVFPLVSKAAVDFHRLRLDTQTATTAILDNLHKQIAEQLTPTQREHFTQLLLERERERAKRNLGNPGDRGPRGDGKDRPPGPPPGGGEESL